jgi:hypothetical protein
MFSYRLADNYRKNYGVVKDFWRRYVLDTAKLLLVNADKLFSTLNKDLRVIQKAFSQCTSDVAGFMQNQN